MTSVELLRKAAAALNNGENPLSTGFLTENSVTLDEVLLLAEQLAQGAEIIARGIEKPLSQEGQVWLMLLAERAMGDE